MAYCCGCGKALGEDAKFCSECGTSTAQRKTLPEPAAPPQAIGVVAPKPKRGGWLALEGFILSIVLSSIADVATRNETPTHYAATGIAYGASAAYIAIKLRVWKRHSEVAKGTIVGWAVAILLSFMCVAGLVFALGGAGDSVTNHGSASTKSRFVFDPNNVLLFAFDSKKALLEGVKLESTWHKEGLGDIMVADFTVENPTQHGFKDFEITCTHSGPSGTVIDSNTITIYEIVSPESTKIVDHVNMGLIPSQAQESDCKITNLVPLQ